MYESQLTVLVKEILENDEVFNEIVNKNKNDKENYSNLNQVKSLQKEIDAKEESKKELQIMQKVKIKWRKSDC